MADVKIKPGRIRSVRTLQDVVDFLSEDLDWPIIADDLEDASFDFTPDELGIPSEQVPALKSVRQLRPLVAEQPWGVFFIEFSGPRLPITPLRRLLQALVKKGRAGGDGSRKAWNQDDLLFIITTDSGDSVELHFLAFFDSDGSSPEIRSIPWRPDESPDQYMRRLAGELLPRLAWPDETNDTGAWTRHWRDAFRLRHGEAISSSEKLAQRMAATAQSLRASISYALGLEDGNGPFTDLLEEVRAELVANVDESKFADMCAQTLVYGLLGSRISDPSSFGASPTLSALPIANSFLAAFFERVHDQIVELNLDDSGLEQLVADLRKTNVEAILDQFRSTAKGGDPVIHFYEDFLALYDRQMRADAGAFYTPQPVVSFMVRAVDQALRDEFGLAGGIADNSTWSEVSSTLGLSVPQGIDPESRFISMLDPATGTGTFVVEWLEQARRSFEALDVETGWPDYLREVVLPSIHAFELMLAPYSVAHMKVALAVENQGVDAAPISILLTDSLDFPDAAPQFESLRDPVAVEGQRAADLKQDEPFTVMIGNPPYDREQHRSDKEREGKRKGGVVRHGVSGVEPLIGELVLRLKDAGLGRYAPSLYNDYVYFWIWAIWQLAERNSRPGVLAFVTASSYLDGKSFGSLRAKLRRSFDQIWIIDLGGDGRGANKEENIFDIQTAVSVAICVRTTAESGSGCQVSYCKVDGDRSAKLAALEGLRLDKGSFTPVGGAGSDSLVPQGTGDYFGWPALDQLFPWSLSGCKVARTWPIATSPETLDLRWKALALASRDERRDLLKATREREPTSLVAPFRDSNAPKLKPLNELGQTDTPEEIVRYGYRSFDRQWLIADNRVVDFRRPDLWDVEFERQVYVTTLTSTPLGRGPALIATPYVPDLDAFRGSFGGKNVFPMFSSRDEGNPNVSWGALEFLADLLDCEIGFDDLFAYTYGLAGTAAFADRFAAELASSTGTFRVPITSDAELFQQVAKLGRDLLHVHTWGERYGPVEGWVAGESRASVLNKVGDFPKKFEYSSEELCLFVGEGKVADVSQEVWDFEVSGLRVLQSWLGNRMLQPKGRRSSPLDAVQNETWGFTGELLTVIGMLEYTVQQEARGAELIDLVLQTNVVRSGSLPQPLSNERSKVDSR